MQMGLSSATTVNETMKFCIFDLRRGQNEGEELDKILFFYPSDLPYPSQLSVIGLSEGLITFTRTFSPEAPCEVIEAEKHSHVFYEAEPDIWMVMIVEKSKETEAIWRSDALRKILKEMHSLFVMFHGYIRPLLDNEPAGGFVRPQMYYFFKDYLSGCAKLKSGDTLVFKTIINPYVLTVINNSQHFKNGVKWIFAAGADFVAAKKLRLPNFRHSLTERGTVQMLTVGREAAIDVQALVKVLESCTENSQCYSMILFQDLLVSTTLSPDDTINLFTYATLRLTPHALSSGLSSWSSLLKGNASSNATVGSASAISGLVSDQDTSFGGERSYHSPRPLQNDKWVKGKDGFLITDIWNVESGTVGCSTPTIWLQKTEEKVYLCAFQHRNLTLILLIPVASVSNGEHGVSLVKKQVLENASSKVFNVEEKLSKGWGGENAYHVSGYRYLLLDSDHNISRATPPAKVTTLTKESLVTMSKLREKVDLEKSRAKWEDPAHEKDIEISIRAKNNAWVIARVNRGKELYMVLEKANETLLYASNAVEIFSNRYCDGAFSFD